MLGDMDGEAASNIISTQMDMLLADNLSQEVQLDLILAAEASGDSEVIQKLQTYQTEKDRTDSVSVYRESLYGGSPDNGRRIFYQNAAAQCIRCHAVGGDGTNVGPDLAGIGDKLTRRQLLESLVAPNARIAPGYGSVTLTLSDGSTVRGMLSAESDSEITVTGNNGEQVISKSDIENRRNSPSGMFAMGVVLSRDEIRDLVEFLSTLDGSGD
jgi:putative heme-binding domain-containing protein